jgi:RNA polymerase sigma factor (sigma-70 family)
MTPDSLAGRGPVQSLVDHLFRHKAGEMVSLLTRILGVDRLELAEDVVQEAMIEALRLWAFRGVPENPGGWLTTVAKNRALDIVRREKVLDAKLRGTEGERGPATPHPERVVEDPFGDDQLTMMFLCCHPALSEEGQIALTLKTVGGFGVGEIARAFLVPEATIAQRLVRAKKKLRAERLPFELPSPGELGLRLASVLRILYLLFNEGYTVSEGRNLVREDLCAEALRFCTLLAAHRVGDRPEVHALLALMLFQASRFETRTDAEGNLLLMAEQDRSRWNASLIQQGLEQMTRAATGDRLSEYHLLAGISACHAAAVTFQDTDWGRILFYYDALLDLAPSPVTALNRAVAVAMIEGPDAGIAALDRIGGESGIGRYYLLPATYGELYERRGDVERAAGFYRQALGLMKNVTERKFLIKKLERCQRS